MLDGDKSLRDENGPCSSTDATSALVPCKHSACLSAQHPGIGYHRHPPPRLRLSPRGLLSQGCLGTYAFQSGPGADVLRPLGAQLPAWQLTCPVLL